MTDTAAEDHLRSHLTDDEQPIRPFTHIAIRPLGGGKFGLTGHGLASPFDSHAVFTLAEALAHVEAHPAIRRVYDERDGLIMLPRATWISMTRDELELRA